MEQQLNTSPGTATMEDPVQWYQIAKAESDERFGSHRAAAQHWRRASQGLIVLCIFLAGGLIYVGTQPKKVPYPIYMDRATGTLSYPGPNSDNGKMTDAVWDAAKNSALTQFLIAWRTVTTDRGFANILWDQSFQFVAGSSPAATQLRKWYVEHDPHQRANNETVRVEIISGNSISEHTYEMVWKETKSSITGDTATTQQYRGVFTYRIQPKWDDVTQKNVNPFGIRITEFSYSEEAGKE